MRIFQSKSKFFYGENTLNGKSLKAVIFCSHPFTNWSLNPFYETNGCLQHTTEGFRKTSEHNSLKNFIKEFSNATKVYCMGGSTTYSSEVYDYNLSWPYKLSLKLNRDDLITINAGVGGWGTLQSLIRYIGWGPIIRPELTIVYQSKNDLTPLYVGRQGESEVLPLMENIMVQFDSQLKGEPKRYRSCNGGLGVVYTDEIYASEDGLKRCNDEWLNLAKSRYETVSTMAKSWGGKVLFVPELINGGPYYDYMQKLHDIMEKVSKEQDNAIFFDVRSIFPMNSDNFLDALHFSETGCETFSEILKNKITKGL